ncbi:MAG TPA: hypothetical protein PLZ75_01875 [Bacteroidales bacterium]|nr:hypothetical protein [Bacteroidales bacterium]HQH23841.1 hypothetical protein [Bacteroidales bacterium]
MIDLTFIHEGKLLLAWVWGTGIIGNSVCRSGKYIFLLHEIAETIFIMEGDTWYFSANR